MVLPHTPAAQAGLIVLKLKLRLRYIGYVMHHFVRPENIKNALEWLLDNNPVRPLLIIGNERDYLRVICLVPSLTAVHANSVHVYLCVCA